MKTTGTETPGEYQAMIYIQDREIRQLKRQSNRWKKLATKNMKEFEKLKFDNKEKEVE